MIDIIEITDKDFNYSISRADNSKSSMPIEFLVYPFLHISNISLLSVNKLFSTEFIKLNKTVHDMNPETFNIFNLSTYRSTEVINTPGTQLTVVSNNQVWF